MATPIASILPFFQAVLSLSFLVLIIIIARLYRGIRILNARVDILSTVVRNLRKEVEMSSGIDEIAFDEFDAFDAQLQSQLKGDFSLKKHASQELQAKFSGRDLVRSSIDLEAVTAAADARTASSPEGSEGAETPDVSSPATPSQPPKGKDLESYEAKESGLQVEVKSDLSYIGKPQEGENIEPIPALPDATQEPEPTAAK